MRKNVYVFRTILRLLILFSTMLILIVTTTAFHLPGFSAVSFAHASLTKEKTRQVLPPCAAQPSEQNCSGQDPVMQGCDRDAQTVAFIEVLASQPEPVARVERRYSHICRSQWGRILQYGKRKQPIAVTIAEQPPRLSRESMLYSNMIFVPILDKAPLILGDVSTNGRDIYTDGSVGYQARLKPAQ